MNINTRLFFRINRLVGKNRYLDWFGTLGADAAIVIMVILFALFLWQRADGWGEAFFLLVKVSALAWLVGWSINVLIGLVAKKPRPHAAYPKSKLLIRPWSNWKTFPSDHAMSAWLIFFLVLVFGLPLPGLFVALALWVCWGRVFVGVHYPADVLAGLGVAMLVLLGIVGLLTR